jgi:hypothetical protein
MGEAGSVDWAVTRASDVLMRFFKYFLSRMFNTFNLNELKI